MKINPIVVAVWGCLVFAGMGVQSAGAGSLSGIRKILYLGNSITLHPPKLDINWSNNWGMAASAEAKDYVHVATAAIAARTGVAPEIRVRNIADFERDYATFDVENQFVNEFAFQPDLFVLAIGENVTLTDATQFKSGVLRIINGVLAQNSAAIVVVRSCFWADTAKDQALSEAARQAGAIFVNIGALGGIGANYAYSEPPYNDPAFSVFNTHPGDTGMAAIANAIVQAVVGRYGDHMSVTENNLFVGKQAVASSVWQYSADFPVANTVDGTGNDFVFAQGDTQQRLVVHGFNSRLRVIRLWTASDLPPTQVTIRSSTSDISSLNGADYETLLVSTVDLPNSYPATWRCATEGYHRDFLVQAPDGTKSVWFDFGSGNGLDATQVGWARIREVQGFSAPFSPFITDNNLFLGAGTTATASSSWQYSTAFPLANAIDGTGSDFVFAQGDSDQRLVIHGFNSRLRLIRLWTDLDLNPTALTVRSSTNDNASVDDVFETLLVPTTTSPHAKGSWRATTEGYYVDLLVQAPEGTRSVWLGFGSGNGNSDSNIGWARIREVQGFSALFAPFVAEDNLFPGAAAASSSVFGDGTVFPLARAIDGTADDFVFANGDAQQRLVVHGFNSGLGLIRLWSDWDIPPTQVTIRSSTNDNASVDDTFETLLVPAVGVPNTLPPWTVASGGYYTNFFVQAPEGTRSVWFDFGSGNGYDPANVGWARIREVQGFPAAPSVADPNLLSGKPVAASSELPSHGMVNATDGESGGEGKDFVFDASDASQRLVVHGFYGAVRLVRIWAGDLRPRRLTLKSSAADQTSLNAADYETTLVPGPVSLDGRWITCTDSSSYVEIAVSAPKGTRSLFADFGSGNDTSPDLGFARITEIQAFKAPGPSGGTILTVR